MTLEQMTEAYPNRGFVLFRVERGEGDGRKLTWYCEWECGYFTSDTDRHIYHRRSRDDMSYGGWFGDTPEEALENMVRADLQSSRNAVKYRGDSLEEAKQELREKADRLSRYLGESR